MIHFFDLMGTRAQLYVYLVIDGKRVLVYTAYHHHDGHDWIADVTDRLKELMKDTYVLSDLVNLLISEFGPIADGFAGDTEASAHVDLVLDSHVALDTSQLVYEERSSTYYGNRETGYYGDCWTTEDFTVSDQLLGVRVKALEA